MFKGKQYACGIESRVKTPGNKKQNKWLQFLRWEHNEAPD